jgi:hypothetical protein
VQVSEKASTGEIYNAKIIVGIFVSNNVVTGMQTSICQQYCTFQAFVNQQNTS